MVFCEGGVSVFQGYSKSIQATGTARPCRGMAALTTWTPSTVVWGVRKLPDQLLARFHGFLSFHLDA